MARELGSGFFLCSEVTHFLSISDQDGFPSEVGTLAASVELRTSGEGTACVRAAMGLQVLLGR